RPRARPSRPRTRKLYGIARRAGFAEVALQVLTKPDTDGPLLGMIQTCLQRQPRPEAHRGNVARCRGWHRRGNVSCNHSTICGYGDALTGAASQSWRTLGIDPRAPRASSFVNHRGGGTTSGPRPTVPQGTALIRDPL